MGESVKEKCGNCKYFVSGYCPVGIYDENGALMAIGQVDPDSHCALWEER